MLNTDAAFRWEHPNSIACKAVVTDAAAYFRRLVIPMTGLQERGIFKNIKLNLIKQKDFYKF